VTADQCGQNPVGAEPEGWTAPLKTHGRTIGLPTIREELEVTLSSSGQGDTNKSWKVS